MSLWGYHLVASKLNREETVPNDVVEIKGGRLHIDLKLGKGEPSSTGRSTVLAKGQTKLADGIVVQHLVYQPNGKGG